MGTSTPEILNERVLQAVLALAEELHYGRAAAKLHVSQPALSGTVKSLEMDLGVCLFKRNSRHVELSDAGHVFVAEARQLMTERSRILALVRKAASEIAGPLRIGYPPSMNLSWLGSLITYLRVNRNGLSDVEFISSDSSDPREQLGNRELHASFVVGCPCHPNLQFMSLFREPFAAAVGAEHSLASHEVRSFRQFEDEPVIWLRRDVNQNLHDTFLASLSSQGYRPRIVQEVASFYECLQFARERLGITFLPQSMRANSTGGEPVFLSLPKGAPEVEYTLAYCQDGELQLIDEFIKFVREHLRRTFSLVR